MEAALGRLAVLPVKAPLAAHAGTVSIEEADLYGCTSPRGRPSTSPLPAGSSASEGEAIVRIVAPVLHIMPELQELCGEPASPMSMVHQIAGSLEASMVPLLPAPPPLQKLGSFVRSPVCRVADVMNNLSLGFPLNCHALVGFKFA